MLKCFNFFIARDVGVGVFALGREVGRPNHRSRQRKIGPRFAGKQNSGGLRQAVVCVIDPSTTAVAISSRRSQLSRTGLRSIEAKASPLMRAWSGREDVDEATTMTMTQIENSTPEK